MLGRPAGSEAAETARGGGAVLASGAGGTGVQPDGGGPKSGGGGVDGLGPPTPGRVLSCGNSRAVLLLEVGLLGGGVRPARRGARLAGRGVKLAGLGVKLAGRGV